MNVKLIVHTKEYGRLSSEGAEVTEKALEDLKVFAGKIAAGEVTYVSLTSGDNTFFIPKEILTTSIITVATSEEDHGT